MFNYVIITVMTCCKNPAKLVVQLFHVFICVCGSSVGLRMYDYKSLCKRLQVVPYWLTQTAFYSSPNKNT